MNVGVSAASGENTLYLWMPRILPTPEQRKIELVGRDPNRSWSTTGRVTCTPSPISRRAASIASR